jgi:hypothetical protein
LAKELKPNHIYWNMATPFRGTRIREWYDIYGKVFDVINHSSWVDGDFMCDEPCAETPDFSIEERKKAYLMAILETNDTRLWIRDIPSLIPHIKKYKLYREFFYWLPQGIKKSLMQSVFLLYRGVKIYRETGINGLNKKIYRHYSKGKIWKLFRIFYKGGKK